MRVAGGEASRFVTPPSVLPDISPTRGEISSFFRIVPRYPCPMANALCDWPLSPIVGEMSGRTEGGAKERNVSAGRLPLNRPT